MRIVSRYINTQIFKAVLFVTTGFLALFAFFDVLNDLSFTSRTANTYGLGNSMAYIVMLLPITQAADWIEKRLRVSD